MSEFSVELQEIFSFDDKVCYNFAMNMSVDENNIVAKINMLFGKFLSNFRLRIDQVVIEHCPLWRYTIMYVSKFDDMDKSLSDAVPVHDSNAIIEIVWRALCSEAKDVLGSGSSEFKEIEARGVSLGFVTEDQKAR